MGIGPSPDVAMFFFFSKTVNIGMGILKIKENLHRKKQK